MRIQPFPNKKPICQFYLRNWYNNKGSSAASGTPDSGDDNNGDWKKSFKNQDELNSHYNKHKSEWRGISKKDYICKAENLSNQKPNINVLVKIRPENGDLLKFDIKNNELIVLRKDGTIRTFFKPKNGIEYWNKLK